MEGLKVQCNGCKKVLHETTNKYDPNVPPNGSMVRLIYPWKEYGWSAFDDGGQNISTTPAIMMSCPACSSPLVLNGKLNIVKNVKSRAAMNQAAIDAFEDEIEKIETGRWIEPVINVEPDNPGNELICGVCGKKCKSKLGLHSHMRSHVGKSRE